MAYLTAIEDDSAIGSASCSPVCPCATCRRAASNLGEWYVREEEEETPAGASRTPSAPQASPTLEHGFGEQPQRRPISMTPIVISVRPFVVLDRFDFARHDLKAFHFPLITRAALRVVASQRSPHRVRTIRIVGHTDPIGREQYNVRLARQRAWGVRAALVPAIEARSPGLTRRLSILVQSLGEKRPVARIPTPLANSRNRRVEIFLSTVPARRPYPPGPVPQVRPPSPPMPPPSSGPQPRTVRTPTPREAAETVEPLRPETPEERIDRIIRTPLPSPRPQRTFSQAFWDRVDRELDSATRQLPIRPSLRRAIKRAVRASIERAAESILDAALRESRLSREAQEAIRAAARRAAQQPVP